MRILAVALLVWGLLAGGVAQAADLHAVGRVDLRDVSKGALIHMVGDITNVNVVGLSSGMRDRVSLTVEFSSIDELVLKLAQATDLGVTMVDGVVVLHPQCAMRRPPSAGRAPASRPVSFYFQHVPLRQAFEVLGAHWSMDGADLDMFNRSHVAIRMKDIDQGRLLKAAAYAAGFDAVANAEGGFGLRSAVGADCAHRVKGSHNHAVASPDPQPRERSTYCPYRAPDKEGRAPTCGPLEFHDTRALLPRGFVEGNGRWFAVVETPDHLAYSVRVGDYLGRDHGKVTRIAASGISLREILLDDDRIWREVTTELRYGENVPSSAWRERRSYIQDDSPQDRYDGAMGDVLKFVGKLAVSEHSCKSAFPKLAPRIAAAASAWDERNAETLQLLRRHIEAYAERMGEDIGMGRSKALSGLSRHSRAQALGEFDAMSPSERAVYCEGHVVRLGNGELDLKPRFESTALELAAACKRDWTCPNL